MSLLADETKSSPITPETITVLHGLHPSGISLPARPALRRPFQDDESKPRQLLKSFRSFKPLRTPGPSGLHATHLREAFDVPCLDAKHALQEQLLKWVETSVTGELPSWGGPWLASAKLVPPRKPTGGLRPVAVGETLRRLSSKVLQQVYCSRLASSLAPLQLGVAVRGAAEQIGRKLRRQLAEDPGRYVLQVDLSKAFTTVVDRADIHNAIIERFPELQSCYELTHGRPSSLFCG